ncbi:MAG: HAD family hydrolase [Spirochaetaceae bacterium]|nr:HAD family hydrolase [Spirochaetaceae bacterium]
MNTEAVIFDLDGTLLNTIDDLADSMNQVLHENSLPEHDRDKYFYFVGNGARKLVERALPEGWGDEKSVEKFLNRYREVYGERWNRKTRLYSGIEDLLLKLRELQIPLAILSNKPHKDVLKVVAHYFDNTLFSVIAGQKEHLPHKPSPDGVFLILKELNVLRENCLFVGDSSVDMQTAVNGGLKAVGVSWGFRSVKELREYGADFIIDDPLELLFLL